MKQKLFICGCQSNRTIGAVNVLLIIAFTGCQRSDSAANKTTPGDEQTPVTSMPAVRSSVTPIPFPEPHTFQPSIRESTGEIECYLTQIRFRDSDAKLVIYPDVPPARLPDHEIAMLRQRFDAVGSPGTELEFAL